MGEENYEIEDFTERDGITIERRRWRGPYKYDTEYTVSLSPEYFEGDVEFVRQGWHQARCLAIFLNCDYWQVVDAEDGMVPEEIALEGKPAIAAYLCGVHEYTLDQIAEMMDVTRDTIVKYLSRFDPTHHTE